MEALRRYAIPGCLELIDIGANIARLAPAALEKMLLRSEAAGVKRIVVTGTGHRSTNDAQRTAANQKRSASGVLLYYTAGIHPHDSSTFSSTTPGFLEKHLLDPLCVAVGETGLDYDRMRSTREQQLASFAAHVAVAKKLNKPLFLHERDVDAHKGARVGSHRDLCRVLDEHAFPSDRVCIHCFTGTAEDLRDYVKRGYYVGITGFVGKNNRGKALREALQKGGLPVERLMIETDTPYMKPDGVPGELGVHQRDNEPCTLCTIVRVLAECYGIDDTRLANHVTANTLRFFNLPAPGRELVR
eukprot:gene10547-16220_t